MQEEDFFFESDIKDTRFKPRQYSFKHRWGVPVRYHDFARYYELVKPNLFEFHLSYSDMDLDPAQFLKGPYDCGFVIHAPELFKGSHLMDLATPDEAYRKYSLEETQKEKPFYARWSSFFPKIKLFNR